MNGSKPGNRSQPGNRSRTGNPALLLVSGRREVLASAVALLSERHGRIVLAAPTHMELGGEYNDQVIRLSGRRFGIASGIHLLGVLGCRWENVYYLAHSVSAGGMENVLSAALIVGRRVHVIAPDGEIEIDFPDGARRVAERLLQTAGLASALAPCWMISSLCLTATSRGQR